MNSRGLDRMFESAHGAAFAIPTVFGRQISGLAVPCGILFGIAYVIERATRAISLDGVIVSLILLASLAAFVLCRKAVTAIVLSTAILLSSGYVAEASRSSVSVISSRWTGHNVVLDLYCKTGIAFGHSRADMFFYGSDAGKACGWSRSRIQDVASRL